MRTIRSTLCWFFALEALVCLWSVPVVVLQFMRSREDGGAAAIPHVVVNSPMVVAGIIFAITCWMGWSNRTAARWWGLAASGVNVAFAAMTIFIYFYAPLWNASAAPRMAMAISEIAGIEAIAGIAGLVTFGGWNLAAEIDADSGAPHIEGDGTRWLLDRVIWVAAFGGFVAGMWGWWLWGQAQGLASRGMLVLYGEFVLAELAMVTVHELGHTLTGKALGMRLRAFIVGPFQWRVRDGHWTFEFRASDFWATGGATAVVPGNAHQPRRDHIRMIAGGPLASLLAGLAGLALLLEAPRHAWRNEWELLALFTTLSLLSGVVNLLPSQTKKRNYSDGAQIYQLLSGGAWGDYHHAMGIVGATTVTALRPRDYDIAAMERAAAVITQGQRALLLRLLISSYYTDCGQMKEAGLALNAAEDVFHDSAGDIPVELYTAFVTGKALVLHDAEGAREWWDRMEAKKATKLNADYWLARAAFLWIEGGRDEALAAWEKGNALVQLLPQAGAYEMDRDKYAQLRRELDAEGGEVAERLCGDEVNWGSVSRQSRPQDHPRASRAEPNSAAILKTT